MKILWQYLLAAMLAINVCVADSSATQIADVAQYVQTIPLLQQQHISITPLSGGLTNRVYLIKISDKPSYVLRVFGAEAESLGIDRSAQAAIAIKIGALQVGPKVVLLSADNSKMLIEFVGGAELKRSQYNATVRDLLISKIKLLHEHGDFSTEFDPFATAQAFQQSALHKSSAIVATFPLDRMAQAAKIVSKIQAILAPHAKNFIRSAHNDLHWGNILYDPARGSLYLIDFDYSGRCDLFFDLGIFANSFNLNAQESNELLTAYFAPRTPTLIDAAHLELMRLMSVYWNSMWYFSQVGSSTIEHNYLQDAIANLDKFLQRAQSRAFAKYYNDL